MEKNWQWRVWVSASNSLNTRRMTTSTGGQVSRLCRFSLLLITLVSLHISFIVLTDRITAATAPTLLVYTTDSGIFLTDSQGSAPKTLVAWVGVVGRNSCASVSISPRGRYLAAVHPLTDGSPGAMLELIPLADGVQGRRVLSQLYDSKLVNQPGGASLAADLMCNNPPMWSSSGNGIVFRSFHEKNATAPGLYNYTISTTKIKRLASARKINATGGSILIPPGIASWSPDDKWLVFGDYDPEQGDESVFVVPSDAQLDPQFLYDGRGSSAGSLATVDWVDDRRLVTTHIKKDCSTTYRLSEVASRVSKVVFAGCAVASVYDSTHKIWLINVLTWGNGAKLQPGLYLLPPLQPGRAIRLDKLSGDSSIDASVRIQYESVSGHFIAFNAGGAYTIDPVSAEVQPLTLPGGVAFPPDARISVAPGGAQTVFETTDGVWMEDPGGSAASVITDSAGDHPFLEWSSDGNALYAVRKSGLWVYPVNGQAQRVTGAAIRWAGWISPQT